MSDQPSNRPRRRARAVLSGLAAAVALGLALTWLPSRLVAHADTASTACFVSFRETGAPDPATCLQPASLAFPKVVPWRRADALKEERGERVVAADDRLLAATALAPDASRRRAALDALDALAKAGDFDRSAVVTDAWFTGAAEDGVRLGDAATTDDTRNHALDLALAAGDFAAAERFAARPFSGDPKLANEYERRRGIVLCLRGKRDEGRAALARADEILKGAPYFSEFGDTDAKLAAFACGGAGTPEDVNPYQARGAAALDLVDERVPAARFLREQSTVQTVLPVLAIAIDRAPPRDVYAALALSSPYLPRHDVKAELSPFPTYVSASTLPVPLAAVEHAADRLEALANTPEASKPLVLEESRRFDDDRPTNQALEDPRGTLLRTAWHMWMTAASERVYRDDAAGALAALARAEKIAPPGAERWEAALHLAAGDAEGTLALMGPATIDAVKGDERAVPHLLRALALAKQGRFDEALAAANDAHAAAPDPSGGSLGVVFNTWLMSAWMQAALEVHRARASGSRAALATTYDDAKLRAMDFFPVKDRENMDAWVGVALARDDTRSVARMKLTGIEFGPALGVLPAILYVVGDAARGAGDVDVWLDRVAPKGATPLRGMLLARAEAARWRGDEAAAAKLEARVHAISAIVVDDESAYLAKLLRL